MADESDLVHCCFPSSDEGERDSLSCVEYPGLVDNVDRALSSLGGSDAVSESLLRPQMPLFLSFRPDDPNCQPVGSRKRPCVGILLRCKRRKEGGTGEGGVEEGEGSQEQERGNSAEEHAFEAEVVGTVDCSVEFSDPCEFQLLHPGLNASGRQKGCSRDNYGLTRLLHGKDFTSDVPLFLPPPVLSRFHTPMKFNIHEDVKVPEETLLRRAVKAAQLIAFDHQGPVPDAPLPGADIIPASHPAMEKLAKLFQERPIWSRVALEHYCRVPQIKKYLSNLAYHFTSGPWRLLWVRLGYDPRTSPESKIYQSIDVRIPQHFENAIPAASHVRVHHPLSYQRLLEQQAGPSGSRGDDTGEEGTGGAPAHVFKPDCLPQKRFLVYQMCDLEDESLQRLIHANDGQEPLTCNQSSGWCEPDTYEMLRKRILAIIKAKLDHTQLRTGSN